MARDCAYYRVSPKNVKIFCFYYFILWLLISVIGGIIINIVVLF